MAFLQAVAQSGNMLKLIRAAARRTCDSQKLNFYYFFLGKCKDLNIPRILIIKSLLLNVINLRKILPAMRHFRMNAKIVPAKLKKIQPYLTVMSAFRS